MEVIVERKRGYGRTRRTVTGVKNPINSILNAGEGKQRRHLERIVQQVDVLDADMRAMSDDELRAQTQKFRERLEAGETLDDLMAEAFATVREASRRTLGKRHFDVQIMGGAALHMGKIAQMRTGEGKTLVATLPSYLNALEGKGVHVVTVNDYLASEQAEQMGRVHRALGLSVGCILSSMTPAERQEQYACDITYGTNNEFGFDYLRDNMVIDRMDMVQRGHHYAIVDEIDSILIDEARTPLIVSDKADETSKWDATFADIVLDLKRAERDQRTKQLTKNGDYEVDEKKKTVSILESGIEYVEDYLGIENLYDSDNAHLTGYLNNAIKAKELFLLDKDYVVRDGKVDIVDEHTGRILSGRRFSDGLHQALEAKEGVEIQAESVTQATVTLQNYFRKYTKLSGMTGTAQSEAGELYSVYKLAVADIPTNNPPQRIDEADRIYATEMGKFRAVVAEVKRIHATGQPVLLGTASVERSEVLSQMLDEAGVPHTVLNAKEHGREAAIVAEAGQKGAVTVSTNMAGRGTDIILGGNPEMRAERRLAMQGLDPERTPEEYEAAWPETLAAAQAEVKAEHDEVIELGGLYVIGTERHESRRIDDQLRGRAGRQGDPGNSRFFLSLQDEMMRQFNSGLALRFMGEADDVPLENGLLTKAIASAQRQMEGRNRDTRKNILKYDDVIAKQRDVFYDERRDVINGDIDIDLHHLVRRVIRTELDAVMPSIFETRDELERVIAAMREVYPCQITADELMDEYGGLPGITPRDLVDEFTSDALYVADDVAGAHGEKRVPGVLLQLMLRSMDDAWRAHLMEMDYIKEGIGLRQMAQRDPLVEYQREGFAMFTAMTERIRRDALTAFYSTNITEAKLMRDYANLTLSGPSETGGEVEVEFEPHGHDEAR